MILSQTGFSQPWYFENFDTIQIDKHGFYRDTISNPNNTWQIGFPHKEGFKLNSNGGRALMTDTINNLPINDTSSFILDFEKTVQYSLIYDRYEFDFKIFGGQGDFGLIEYSRDTGKTWKNIMGDPEWDVFPLDSLKYKLNDSNWRSLSIINKPYLGPKARQLRFTFITDSIEDGTEGWIIDRISIARSSSIHSKYKYSNLLQIYPNPASSYLHIECIDCYGGGILQIFDMEGKRVFYNPEFTNTGMDISSLSPGIYTLLYQENGQSAMERIVVER